MSKNKTKKRIKNKKVNNRMNCNVNMMPVGIKQDTSNGIDITLDPSR